MDQGSLKDALSIAQDALSGIYDTDEEDNEEYSDMDDDELDEMLKEESKIVKREDRRTQKVTKEEDVIIEDNIVEEAMIEEENSDEILVKDNGVEEVIIEEVISDEILVKDNGIEETSNEDGISDEILLKEKPVNESKKSHSNKISQSTPIAKPDPVSKKSKNLSKQKSLHEDDFEEMHVEEDPIDVRNNSFSILEEILKSQIDDCKRMVQDLQYTDRNKSSEMEKMLKSYENDLRLVKLAHSTSDVPLPLYVVEEKEVKHEIINHEVSENELEIVIEKLKDVKPSPSSKDPYPGYYVLCSFQHPEATQKFKTSTLHTYVYNHSHNFIIDRQKKIDKKKIVIEVLKNGQWLFSEPTLIGKCEIPLTELLNSCSRHIITNIVKEKRKVAEIYVSLKLKYPLKDRKYDTKVLKHVKIKKHFGSFNQDSNSQQEVKKEIVESKKSNVKPEIVQIKQAPIEKKPTETKPNKSVRPTPKQKNAPLSKPNYFVPIDHLFSIGVLEYEKTRNTQMLQVAKRNKNEDDIIDLEQRITELNTKMMLLNYQAQSGQLSQDDYIAIVKKKIEEELILAKKLKETNKEAALEAMKRKKVMEKELSGG